jgi:hypothetical protein
MGIPYYEIPIRTSETRLGKYALMGFLERLNEEMERQADNIKNEGSDVYESEL